MAQASFSSPLGGVILLEENEAIIALRFVKSFHPSVPSSPLLKEAVSQLQAYFEGRLTRFSLPLRPEGTPFQLQVWQALQSIPYGQVISYGQLAESIGKPGACRAVGGANGKNRLPILIPCHRVIAANGSLGGYSTGESIDGQWIKKGLLALEGVLLSGR